MPPPSGDVFERKAEAEKHYSKCCVRAAPFFRDVDWLNQVIEHKSWETLHSELVKYNYFKDFMAKEVCQDLLMLKKFEFYDQRTWTPHGNGGKEGLQYIYQAEIPDEECSKYFLHLLLTMEKEYPEFQGWVLLTDHASRH